VALTQIVHVVIMTLLSLQVGMSIDPKLFVAKFPTIMGALTLLIGGKTLLVTGVGRYFGLSTVAAVRAGLLLAPGGEFAFVAFGEAVNQASSYFEINSYGRS
jgi:Kef-type K+ transport system membrane component KefB